MGSKGPARVILREERGVLVYCGVVSHKQELKQGSPGHGDHYRVYPKFTVGDVFRISAEMARCLVLIFLFCCYLLKDILSSFILYM